jgi:nicotinamide-nucleotide amidase
MTAEIITIGDEMLIGQVVDTNSAQIARELDSIGIAVHEIRTIEDDREHILSTLRDVSGRADVVIMTGGLGPTKDDVTKYTLCEFFDDTLVMNEEVLEHIEELFKKIGNVPVSDLNREQAMVPSKAQLLKNKYGTAPGLWLEKEGTVVIAVPGVPFEMKTLMEQEIIPRLKEKFDRPFILHKTIRTYGIGESALAERIAEWEDNLPDFLRLAYLPDLGSVRLRLSGRGKDEAGLKAALEKEMEKLYPLVKDIRSDRVQEDDDISVTISKLLQSKNMFLAAAESCTGGELAAEFNAHPRGSRCCGEGMVCYAKQAERESFRGPAKLIKEHNI